MELRFRTSSYENHQANLFKLKQTSTVAAYQAEFEQLINQVDVLTLVAIRNYFISKPRTYILNEIAIHSPTTLHQTYDFTKLIEDNLSNEPRYTTNTS